jgi:hypothetical protein
MSPMVKREFSTNDTWDHTRRGQIVPFRIVHRNGGRFQTHLGWTGTDRRRFLSCWNRYKVGAGVGRVPAQKFSGSSLMPGPPLRSVDVAWTESSWLNIRRYAPTQSNGQWSLRGAACSRRGRFPECRVMLRERSYIVAHFVVDRIGYLWITTSYGRHELFCLFSSKY